MKTIEICAGAGGQALGLHEAGMQHVALVENDPYACETLETNNRIHELGWGEIFSRDLEEFIQERASEFAGEIDLVAGGVPCPPFSDGGLKRGKEDERDLFPAALDLVEIVRPFAVMIENVDGLMDSKFDSYRAEIQGRLSAMGYDSEWQKLFASEFGVPQLRPRSILVALPEEDFLHFSWPKPSVETPPTVGEALYEQMAANGWEGASEWRENAKSIAPTIVGGSKKHGGPDLGPTRAKHAWKALGVNGHRIANEDEVPGPGFMGAPMRGGGIREGFERMPQLTLQMVAKLQGFPDYWVFSGRKTHAYRQIGNAFPPPVAKAVGLKIHESFSRAKQLSHDTSTGLSDHSAVAAE